jgi:protein O-GlcNAc transferase
MTAVAPTQSELSQNLGQAYRQALQLTLQQAVGFHHAGQLQEAGQLYRSVLQADSEHPEANHNLGVLLLEELKSDASLPHFEAALAAKPDSGRYWLSYLNALVLAGRTELARGTLAFAREHGLEGDAVEEIAHKIDADKAENAADAAQAINA